MRRAGGEAINEDAVEQGPIDLGAESLVLPALGCGVAGFDLREGGRIICGTIHQYEPGSLSEVRLIGYSDEEFETLVKVAKELRNGGA